MAVGDKAQKRVEVELGDRSYPVLIGPGASGELIEILPAEARRVAVVTQENIGISLDLGDRLVKVFNVPDGEEAKNFIWLEWLVRGFVEFSMTRSDVVLAVGGGVVSDLAGLAASIYHRGIRVINVATSLLAMVDAAIGGKTAINIPEGKNLIGTFHQPLAVICDTDHLRSLPEEELYCGRGEMAKYAFLGAPDLIDLPLVSQISACVSIKASFVSQDEREGSKRALLNYGHTLAHAIEAQAFGPSSPRIKHGQAVGVGLVFAARLAEKLARIGEKEVAFHRQVVTSYGLDPEIPAWVRRDELVEVMLRDKKVKSGLTFVLDGEDGLEVVSDIDPEIVRSVLDLAP